MKSGFVILDKPSGMTSRRAGGIVARMFGQKKFGHIGTLDPMASGVLPIALGEATKMIPYLDDVGARGNAPEKEYLFSIKWGIRTDTDDITGKIIEQDENALCPMPCALSAACAALVGVVEQTPPAYSAIKIGGRKACDMARRGVEFEMPKRKVMIYDLTHTPPAMRAPLSKGKGNLTFRVRCSPGTYVRTLAQQIAEKINKTTLDLRPSTHDFICTTDMIRRTASSGFEIKDAVGLDFLENLYNNNPADVEQYLRPVDFGLDDILVLELNDNDAKRFQNGQGIREQGLGISGLRRVYNNSEFLGIGELVDNVLKPLRVINITD